MDVHARKAMTRITRCFLLFLVLHLVEELLIIPRYFNSRGLIACVGGFVILLIYIRFINRPLEQIGMIFSGHKVRKGIILAAIFNLVPAVIVYALEYFRISRLPGHTVISAFYSSARYAYSSAGFWRFAMWLAFGMLLNVIHAFFYETTFRGLLITLGLRSMRFKKINLIQAGLYTFWFLIPVLRLILYYSDEVSAKQILTLFLVMLAYEMLCAIKLGLLRFSTGSVWACIFDHFAFACILDMIHVQHTALDMTVQLDESYYLRIVCYQAISLLMVFIYYINKKKRKSGSK
ncbi:MAG: hypothetical protein IJT41_01285 [Clostridia bacterium]|nr:hypothetical protein [Clostridia bacterium]